jgi:hypothetical protein
MKLYLFKGADGNIETTDEKTAHSWIRNKNSWQRQDLVYQGVVDDAELQAVYSTVKEKARDSVFNELPQVTMLRDKMELAVMKKDENDAKLQELELKVLRGNFDAIIGDRSGNIQNDEHDQWRAKVVKKNNEIMQEAMNNLKGDIKILPRNFNQVTSSFGDEPIPFNELNLA